MMTFSRLRRSLPVVALTLGLLLLTSRSHAIAAAPPDAGFNVPWEGVVWQAMPNFTWAACDVDSSVREVIDIAIGQWRYAETNQGSAVHLTEVSCDANPEIVVGERLSSTATAAVNQPNVLGNTVILDLQQRFCDVSDSGLCVASQAGITLFPDAWARDGLSPKQAAKTVAHEIGHAVGLGHAHLCNFETLMAENCEPILQGLGPDDIRSLDALVDYDRAYFNQSIILAQPADPAPAGGVQVTYPAGWNLVAGPRGTSFAAAGAPLETLLAGDTAYRAVPATEALVGGFGYWAYFSRETTVQLSGAGEPFYTVSAPPEQWFLIGNDSGSAPMRIYGAIEALAFDPQSGKYVSIDRLQPGQAAWVAADAKGEIAVGFASLTSAQVNCYILLGSPGSC